MLGTERHRTAHNDTVIEMRESCASLSASYLKPARAAAASLCFVFHFPANVLALRLLHRSPNTAFFSDHTQDYFHLFIASYNYKVSYWVFPTGKNTAACAPKLDPAMPSPGLQGYTIAEKLVCPNSYPSQPEGEILSLLFSQITLPDVFFPPHHAGK